MLLINFQLQQTQITFLHPDQPIKHPDSESACLICKRNTGPKNSINFLPFNHFAPCL